MPGWALATLLLDDRPVLCLAVIQWFPSNAVINPTTNHYALLQSQGDGFLGGCCIAKTSEVWEADGFLLQQRRLGDFCSPKNDTKGSRSPTLYGLVAVSGCSESMSIFCCLFFKIWCLFVGWFWISNEYFRLHFNRESCTDRWCRYKFKHRCVCILICIICCKQKNRGAKTKR